MNTTYINIEKKNGKTQYPTEVLPEIPTNTILYKKLTGLGATYGELKADRDSIILEPNVPVIKGKCKRQSYGSLRECNGRFYCKIPASQ